MRFYCLVENDTDFYLGSFKKYEAIGYFESVLRHFDVEEKYVIKAIRCYIELFDEEDTFMPDGRAIAGKRRAYNNALNKATKNENARNKLKEIIEQYYFSVDSVIDMLKQNGFIIVGGKNEKL